MKPEQMTVSCSPYAYSHMNMQPHWHAAQRRQLCLLQESTAQSLAKRTILDSPLIAVDWPKLFQTSVIAAFVAPEDRGLLGLG